MAIRITKCQPQPPTVQVQNPKFGSIFAPHLLKMEIGGPDFSKVHAEIKPFHDEPMSPGAVVLHYGQSIFEGLKAYKLKNNGVGIFRLDLHAKRFAKSCRIMSMPELPPEIFEQCVSEYVAFERESVPTFPEHSLYLRPVMFGVDKAIKMGRSQTYTFYVIASMAGSYFAGRSSIGAKVLVNRHFVRAYPGGVGEAKTAANYAISLGPLAYAAELGCDQILYLQASDHDHIDEFGGMNFFAVQGETLVTPPLTGTLLDGVTRRSILELAPQLGLKAKEEPISFTQLMADIESGKVTECFACGTAAVVQPLAELLYQEKAGGVTKPITLPKHFKVSTVLSQHLQKVQRGIEKAPGHWVFEV